MLHQGKENSQYVGDKGRLTVVRSINDIWVQLNRALLN